LPDEEIDAAQAENAVEPMFMDKPEFMNENQWERYNKFVIRASMQAREKLQKRLMKEIADSEKEDRKAEMERIEAEVSGRAEREP
jgi:hypothetical protein